jgi:hypothetical protein
LKARRLNVRREGGDWRLIQRHGKGSEGEGAGVVGRIFVVVQGKKGLALGVSVLVRLSDVLVPQRVISGKFLPTRLRNTHRGHGLESAAGAGLGEIWAAGLVDPGRCDFASRAGGGRARHSS